MAQLTRNINCTLYLEGIEVPFTSVQIVEQMDAPPTCTIAFPASSKAIKVLAGTVVHLFGEVRMREGLSSFSPKEVLLFEGEVSGISYNKNADQRQVSLSCESIFHKWATVLKQSSDILSNKTYTQGLFVISSLADLTDYDKNLDDSSTVVEQTAFSNTKARYAKFDYSDAKAIGGFANSLNASWNANPKAKKRGDWFPFFRDLLESVEALNYYYGLLAKTFKISDSIFVFPNKEITDALQSMIDQESLQAHSPNIGESVTLLQLLNSALQFINYQMLFPAAPTHTQHLTEPDTQVPIRAYFLPDLKWGPPLKSNIIFPSETTSISFNRHMSSEPTRLMAGSPPFSLKGGVTELTSVKAYYMSPGLNFIKQNNTDEYAAKIAENKGIAQNDYVLSFTPEESYKGVKSEQTHITGLEAAYLQQMAKRPTDESWSDEAVANILGGSKEGILAMNAATLSLYALKYGSRSCSITGAWNPFRVVGFPALAFDTDGSPPIMGVLAAHTTSINANGEANSSMHLAFPRLVWDPENLEDVESLLSYQIDSDTDSVLSDAHKFSAFEEDPVPYLENWLDSSWYDSEHVGRDVYSIITEGQRARRTSVPADTSWNSEEKDGSSMEPYVDNFDVEGQRGRSLDSSIFSFIRHKSTGKFILDSKDSIFTPPTDESPPQHIIFALRIGQAIRVLKREYLKMLEKGREQDYIDGITHRNIISKENYWKFFLDRQGEPDPLKDYKGTDSFGLVQGVNPRDIRLLIIDYMKSGFTSMLAYKKLFTDSTSNFSLMLRPFAEKRAAQVKAILYNRKQTPKAGR